MPSDEIRISPSVAFCKDVQKELETNEFMDEVIHKGKKFVIHKTRMILKFHNFLLGE